MIKQEWLDEALNKLDQMPVGEFMSKFSSAPDNEVRVTITPTVEYTASKSLVSQGARYTGFSEMCAEAA
jgi:hypothetical protein